MIYVPRSFCNSLNLVNTVCLLSSSTSRQCAQALRPWSYYFYFYFYLFFVCFPYLLFLAFSFNTFVVFSVVPVFNLSVSTTSQVRKFASSPPPFFYFMDQGLRVNQTIRGYIWRNQGHILEKYGSSPLLSPSHSCFFLHTRSTPFHTTTVLQWAGGGVSLSSQKLPNQLANWYTGFLLFFLFPSQWLIHRKHIENRNSIRNPRTVLRKVQDIIIAGK